MHKTVIILILTTLLLAGCNLPTAKAVPTADMVGTQVAKTVSVASTLESTKPALPVTATATGAASTGTATITSTVTPLPGDPSSTLGTAAWKADLVSGKAFFSNGATSYQDDYVLIKIDGGELVLTSLTASGWKSWRLAPKSPERFYLEEQFTTGDCGPNDNYGMLFRADGYTSGNGYYFGVTCDGRYALSVTSGGSSSTLVDWTASKLLNSGNKQSNRLGAWVDGNTIKLYINGKLEKELTDSTLPSAGYMGAYITGTSTVGFTARLTKMAYWNLP
jgi:hypothetical protein